jgi:lysophospholipase L1-like esterase
MPSANVRSFRRNAIFWAVLCMGFMGVAYRQLGVPLWAQQEWEPTIRGFEQQDKAHPAPAGVVVFTGSSSIAYWSSLVNDMKPLNAINRGFGGSEYSDVNYYADRIVIAYRPAAVVVYAGDNDLASGGRKTAQSVAHDVQQFVRLVHAKLPQTWVFVVSIKPSLARWKRWPEMQAANQLIRDFLSTQDHAAYIDVATPMLDKNGRLSPDLFISDGLHPSAKCYAMWTSIIKPVVLQQVRASSSSSLYAPRDVDSIAASAGASIQ